MMEKSTFIPGVTYIPQAQVLQSNGNRLAHDALDLLQRCLAEMDIACCGGLLELSRSACADNGYINPWLGQHPCNCQLRHAHAFLLRQVLQVLHDRQIALKALTLKDRALAAPVIGGKGRMFREPTAEQ